MKNLFILFWNILLLGLMMLGVEYFDENPRILVYAFLLAYTIKLLFIETLLLVHEERLFPFAKGLLNNITRNPAPGTNPNTLYEEGTKKPVKLSGYLYLMGMTWIFMIPLLHVNKHGELDFSWGVFWGEISWGAFLAIICLIGDIVSHAIIIDVNAPREINFGYNNLELLIIAFAVLVGAFAISLFQIQGKDPTPWLIYGPMILIKQVYDMKQAKK